MQIYFIRNDAKNMINQSMQYELGLLMHIIGRVNMIL